MAELTLALLNDYETQVRSLNQDQRAKLLGRPGVFWGLLCLDVVFCHAIVGPAVISFWRCTWDGTSHFTEEMGVEPWLTNLVCLVTGFLFTFIIDVFHSNLRASAGRQGSLKHSTLYRIFSIFWGVMDIYLWKGIWDGVDLALGKSWQIPTTTAAIGFISLVLFGTLKSALSMPNGISVDTSDSILTTNTYLSSSTSSSWCKRLADGFISRCLEVCVVLMWHGIWTLLDIFSDMCGLTFDESALISLLTGSILGWMLFIFQFLLIFFHHKHNQEKSDKAIYTVLYVVNLAFTFVGIVATIMSFRGVWTSLDVFYMTDNMYGSYLTSMLIGVLILSNLGCLTSLQAGVFKDSPSEGIALTVYLFSHMYTKTLSRPQGISERTSVARSMAQGFEDDRDEDAEVKKNILTPNEEDELRDDHS